MPGTYQYDVEIKSNVAKLLSDMKQVQDRLDTVEGKEYKIKLNVDEKKLSNVISNLENMLDSLGKGTSDFKQFENLSKQLSSITTDIGKISKAFATMDDGSGLVNNIKSIDSSLTNLTNHFVLQVSDKMASSIKEVKGTLSDVGDGKELTPLLNTIGRIESAIDRLSSSVKGIGLNMNIDFGSDTEMEAKAQTKISNALQAYQRLFEHIKMSSAGGSIINTKFFDFDINQYDTAMSKLQAYRKFIENMRNEAKAMYGGQDVLFTDTDKKYWTQASSAMGQVTKTFNEMKAASDANPLENIFGKTDLTEVLNQLSAIVSKLDEISMSANRFADVFKNGLNVNASVEEIEKLTNRVKELESELAKIKTLTTVATPQESNISSGMKDAFPKTSENLEQVAQSEQKVQQEAVATDKALDNISFTPNAEGFDDIIAKFGILREQAEQITKIVKTTKQTADGTSISYKATLRNGSSYYLGENSTPQVLNASETVYDSNAMEKAYQEATKVNNALNETNSLLNSLKVPNGFEGSFSTLESEIKRLNSEFGSGKISATEYANSIKKAFSDYQTPIDNHSKDIWNELTTSLDRYTTLQKRIASNNALSTDNEEAIKLLEHIHELQRSDVLPSEKLNESNKKLQQINQTVTDLKAKLKESTLDSLQGSIDKYQRAYNNYSVRPSNEQSGAYKNALINLNSAIQELEKYKATLSGMSEVTEKQEAHIEKLVSECVKASDAFKQMSASQKGAKEIGIAKSIQRINKDLAENTRYSKTAKQNLQALLNQLESGDPSINLEKINSEMIKIENAEIRAGRAGKSFLDIFKTKAVHGFLGQAQSYLSMYIGFYGMVNKVRSTITTVKELDTALVDLKKTTTMTEQQLNKFYYSSNDVARQMGVTTKEIIEQASAWSRLGYNTAETSTTMAKLSSQFASISPGMEVDESQSGLVSIMKAKFYALIYSNVYLEYI